MEKRRQGEGVYKDTRGKHLYRSSISAMMAGAFLKNAG